MPGASAKPLPGSFAYEQSDIPPGLTIAEYRRRRAQARPTSRPRLTRGLRRSRP